MKQILLIFICIFTIFDGVMSFYCKATPTTSVETLYLSKKFFLNKNVDLLYGGLLVHENGTIKKIFTSSIEIEHYRNVNCDVKVIDFGEMVLMPGLIDTHVHVNEPGREDWEEYITVTKAAAAGGFTTIADMPLNSIPSTTTVENLKIKLNAAKGKIYVDVAFWGGFIPDNLDNLQDLIENGVVGFKCFLCPSGVDEFPNVNEQQIEEALKKLKNTGAVLAFHAELEPKIPLNIDTSHPEKYLTYLNTKPSSMEVEAIEMITKLAKKYNDVRLHIVHLSSADAIPILKNYQNNGGNNLTIETCHHYLSLAAEEIPDYHTEFKCSPPIREKSNQAKLWQAIIQDHIISQIVSDHSPSTAKMKYLLNNQTDKGNFLKAWGGIGSNQFGLSLIWTNGQKYNIQIKDIYRLMSLNPSKLLGINDRKGKFEEGYDADFCVWEPNKEFVITPEIIHFKNKITPYMNFTLRGQVYATFVRGQEVFNISKDFKEPVGEFVFKKYIKKID